ncbi:MAG: SpoIIE family protein phosphatase [Candidatus Velthaea sp.]|jgi:serine phosphatase RsbU (regulator of sigma subunit)
MPLQRAEISTAARVPLLVLVLLIPVLAYAGFEVHGAVDRTARYQQQIRIAQLVRGRVLRYMLDEETGIRGFQATGQTLYLDPYAKAKAVLPGALDQLERDLAPLAIAGTAPIVATEKQQTARWVADIGEPLLRTTSRPHVRSLMWRGKGIVDGLRAQDRQLQELLNAAAASADQRANRAIANVSLFVFAVLAVLTGAATVFGFFQTRTARQAFESRLRYENQKRIADALQTAFLNKHLPATPNLGLHATYIPATSEAQVGGDWYDAIELPDKRILFSIGDVAGHGLEAAVVMSRARQAIIAAALHENDPGKVLERANEAILLQDSRMVTAICGYIDPATLAIVYATAGHPPPILARPGVPSVFLAYDGLPLGIVPKATYRTFNATASDGAVMVLYTDGVIEHKRDVIEGSARLLEVTRLAIAEDDPALAIQRRIFAGTSPTDDVAILTVRFKSAGPTARVASIGALQFNRLEMDGTEGAAMLPNDLPIELHGRTASGPDARLRKLGAPS